MTAPLPNELSPEVREALAWAKDHATPYIKSELHLSTLASYIESLPAPHEGEGMPDARYDKEWLEEFNEWNSKTIHEFRGLPVEVCLPGTRARLSAEPRTWQPMETAPRDGTEVLFDFGDRREAMKYLAPGQIGEGWYGSSIITHAAMLEFNPKWISLPQPPALNGGE